MENFNRMKIMLYLVFTLYVFVIVVMSMFIFMQKGEDTMSSDQFKFMSPRGRGNFIIKMTSFLAMVFISLCLILGIMVKKDKHSIKKELSDSILQDEVQQKVSASTEENAQTQKVSISQDEQR